MKKKTTVETRVEIYEVWVIREPQDAPPVLCQRCAGQPPAMLAPDIAASLAGISLRSLFRLLEAGQLHYLEQADGGLLVCPNSLPGNLDSLPAG